MGLQQEGSSVHPESPQSDGEMGHKIRDPFPRTHTCWEPQNDEELGLHTRTPQSDGEDEAPLWSNDEGEALGSVGHKEL